VVRGLRDWLGKQWFEPQVMDELVDLIKRPMDRPVRRRGEGRRRRHPRPYAPCAVVGNSGVLLAWEHGTLIDAHTW
jgi:beta-1,6-galactosyltransferase